MKNSRRGAARQSGKPVADRLFLAVMQNRSRSTTGSPA